MLTTDDKGYLKTEFVTKDSFGRAMDSIGERFDQNEAKIDSIDENVKEVLTVLTDVVNRLQKMEDNHGTLIEHRKRLDRIDKKLSFPPLAAFKFR